MADAFASWVLPATLLLAAVVCALRASGERCDRLPWSLIGLALLAWSSGSLALVASSIFAVLALRGSRLPRPVAVIVASAATTCVGDGMYQVLIASGTYVPGGPLDVLWIGPAAAMSVAALMRPQTPVAARGELLAAQVAPVALSAVALAVLVSEAFDRTPSAVTVAAPALALMIALARMAMSRSENRSRLAESEEQALTDPLTGLGNRRRLLGDLASMLRRPVSLTIFDLNDFKAYNDTYGHVAGDALLVRIGAALLAAVGPDGRAYRMGGDETWRRWRPRPRAPWDSTARRSRRSSRRPDCTTSARWRSPRPSSASPDL